MNNNYFLFDAVKLWNVASQWHSGDMRGHLWQLYLNNLVI